MRKRAVRAVAPARRAPAPAARDGRQEILLAATREFADHGYAGASTAGIARRAGVTQPLVYHHFGSKQGLWLAVLEALFGDLEREVVATLEAVRAAGRPERLRALLRALVRFSGRRPELSRLIRTESSAGGAAFDLLYGRWLERWVRFVTAELRAAVREGSARRVDPRLGYFAVVGAATALFAEPVAARRAFGIDAASPRAIARYGALVAEVLLAGLLARAPGPAAPGKARGSTR